MAYQHDPDGPVVDKGAFRAFIIEKVGIVILGVIVIFIIIKVFSSEDNSLEGALDLIKIDLRHSRYNYTIDNSEKSFIVTIWESGTTTIAKKAYNGEKEALVDWGKVKDSVLDLTHTIEEDLIIANMKDISVTVILVNEDNHERSLLVFKDAVLKYDVVNETKGD